MIPPLSLDVSLQKPPCSTVPNTFDTPYCRSSSYASKSRVSGHRQHNQTLHHQLRKSHPCLPNTQPSARRLSRSSSNSFTRSLSSLIEAVASSMRRVRDITGSHHDSRSYVGERGERGELGVGGVGEAETCSGERATSSAAGPSFFCTLALPATFFVAFLTQRAFLGARPDKPLRDAVSFGMLFPVS